MDDITSIADIQQLVTAGFTDWQQYGHVTVRKWDDLLIFNYNTMAQYTARWNFFERVSRGLIIHSTTGEVVARGFDKMFNWLQGGRRSAGHIVSVTEKFDGSLGILYRHKGDYRIATRGSFDSDQAQWATQFLNDYFDLTGLPDELTLLFEIIYPGNRIVIDYGKQEDLVLLAARNRLTGDFLPLFPEVFGLAQQYGFTLPKVFQFNDITQIIIETGTLDEQHEGYVVEFSDGQRFKFKGDRYLELHRLITGLTFKNVLRAMENNAIRDIVDIVPDEFLTDVKRWISAIEVTLDAVKTQVQTAFDAAPKTSRRDFALWVQADHVDLSQYLFALWDKKDIAPLIYRNYPWAQLEETAAIAKKVSNES